MKYDTQEIFDAYNIYGSYSKTAKNLGIDPRTVRKHVESFHEQNSFVSAEAHRTGIPFNKISHYWLKTKNEEGDDVSVFVKNQSDVMEYEELRDKLVEDMLAFSPRVDKISRELYTEENGSFQLKKNLLILDPADIHIGKLAVKDETGDDSYNIDIAIGRVYYGVRDLLTKAKLFGISNIVIVVGNDILHTDNTKRTTTGGTPQDTDGQWWQAFEAAREMYVTIIEIAKEVADVTLVFAPSNHDFTLGFGLMDSLYSWYHNDANVTVTNYGKSMRHRKYIQFGNNLIGISHGDGAKNKDLTSLMQYEAKEYWSDSEYAYWYVHHMHHKYRIVNGLQVEKDYNGVTVIGPERLNVKQKDSVEIECIRTPSTPDSWHAKKGFMNMAAIEAFIHDPEFGQRARLTSFC